MGCVHENHARWRNRTAIVGFAFEQKTPSWIPWAVVQCGPCATAFDSASTAFKFQVQVRGVFYFPLNIGHRNWGCGLRTFAWRRARGTEFRGGLGVGGVDRGVDFRQKCTKDEVVPPGMGKLRVFRWSHASWLEACDHGVSREEVPGAAPFVQQPVTLCPPTGNIGGW